MAACAPVCVGAQDASRQAGGCQGAGLALRVGLLARTQQLFGQGRTTMLLLLLLLCWQGGSPAGSTGRSPAGQLGAEWAGCMAEAGGAARGQGLGTAPLDSISQHSLQR